jgi:Conserved oligomeric complex COG6
MRVQQTIRSQESSIVSYKIANLLQFYLMTMRRTIGDALLSTTLKEYVLFPLQNELVLVFYSIYYLRITDGAYKVFYESIEAQSRALSRIPLVCSCSSVGIFFTLLIYNPINRTMTIDRLNHPWLFLITHKSFAK